MEKAKAAQVVHDMSLAKHVDTEVVTQNESRSGRVLALLSGDEETPIGNFQSRQPMVFASGQYSAPDGAGSPGNQKKKLYRLSDASGETAFKLYMEENSISRARISTGMTCL